MSKNRNKNRNVTVETVTEPLGLVTAETLTVSPLQSSHDADPARTGATINDRAAEADAVAEQVKTLRAEESGMVARFKAFRSDTDKDSLKLWAYHYTLRNVFVDPTRGIKTIADFLRDRLNIPADAPAELKSARADWDYLRRCGAVLAGADTKGGSKGATPYGQRVSEYITNNYVIGEGKLTLGEAYALLQTMEARYKVAYEASQAVAA